MDLEQLIVALLGKRRRHVLKGRGVPGLVRYDGNRYRSTVPSELRFANINMNIVESAMGKRAPQTHVLGRRSSVLTVVMMVLNMTAP